MQFIGKINQLTCGSSKESPDVNKKCNNEPSVGSCDVVNCWSSMTSQVQPHSNPLLCKYNIRMLFEVTVQNNVLQLVLGHICPHGSRELVDFWPTRHLTHYPVYLR